MEPRKTGSDVQRHQGCQGAEKRAGDNLPGQQGCQGAANRDRDKDRDLQGQKVSQEAGKREAHLQKLQDSQMKLREASGRDTKDGEDLPRGAGQPRGVSRAREVRKGGGKIDA